MERVKTDRSGLVRDLKSGAVLSDLSDSQIKALRKQKESRKQVLDRLAKVEARQARIEALLAELLDALDEQDGTTDDPTGT